MINEIELQVVPTPVPRARQIMVDQATNQKYEYDEDTNSCSWLASITINAKNKPGDEISATDDSWNTTTVNFLIPHNVSEGDVLEVNEQGNIIQINGIAADVFPSSITITTATAAPATPIAVVPIPSMVITNVGVVMPMPTIVAAPVQGNPMMQQQGNPMMQQQGNPMMQQQGNPMMQQQQQQQNFVSVNPIQPILASPASTQQQQQQKQANYIASIMADEDHMYDDNNVQYTANWDMKTSGCCCLGDNQSANNVKRTDEIFVKDRHVKYIKRTNCSPSCCPSFLQCPSVRTTTLNVNAIHAVVTSEKDIGCCTYFMTFFVWFFCGCCGCHYHLHKRRFRQTWCHRFYVLMYTITAGFFLIGWFVDGFRIYYWLQAYSIKLYGEFEEDTILIDVKSMAIMQRIRDAMYRVMAPGRQINPKKPTVSLLTCEEQESNTTKIVRSEPLGCLKSHRIKMVVTKDRLIMHKENQNHMKNEWTDIFLLSLQGIERTTPEEYPWYYIWFYAFPPWGLFGLHRIKLGHRGFWLRVYQGTFGYLGVGYVFDLFTMCCCIQNLKIKSEFKMVFQRATDLHFHMILHGKQLNSLLLYFFFKLFVKHYYTR